MTARARAVGLACGLTGLGVFGTLTEDVIARSRLTQADAALAAAFRAHATPAGDALWSAVSVFGSAPAIALVTLAVALWLAVRRDWSDGAGWLAAVAGGSALDATLKILIHRPRPPSAALLHVAGFSFPSGHAMSSLVCYGLLAYLVWGRAASPGPRIAAVAAAACLVVGIGFSRLCLGAHYLSDVVGGYAAGAVWLALCISGLEVARRRPLVTPL